MRQIGTQSAKYFRRFVTAMLVFAMVITSLTVSSVDSQAAKKVKKVTIGVKVGGSGILVLKKGQSKKLKVSVTPKKASKKVTYKSSKASIVSVSSKGVVKARKSKGSAKITVTSKQNAKKKATITVKIGTPVKKVAISKTATSTWTSANYTIVEKNGQKTKVYPKYTDKLKAKKNTFKLMNGRNMVIKASVSPKKATRKSLKWSTNKGSVLKVVGNGTKATVIARKVGKANVIAQATDGSGKKAVVKVTVTKFISDKTPAPTAEPDTRKKTTIEDFESYEVGKTWNFTAAGKNSGHMTVVQDPEDASNKCLEIKLDGTEAAFDFSPIFNVDLTKVKGAETKTLGDFSGIGMDLRVVTTSSDVLYKGIFCYFDQYGKMSKDDKFAASGNKSSSAHVDKDGNPVAAGAANEDRSLRFGVNISQASAPSKESAVTLFNGNASTENTGYFPTYHDKVWKPDNASTFYLANSCTTAFKAKEEDGKVGFASRSLTFDTSRINEADNTLLKQNKFDVVFGTTYEGAPRNNSIGATLSWYVDNVCLIEESIPITDFTVTAGDSPKVAPGNKLTTTVTYTPENTTQKGLTWTTNNAKVKVDSNGTVSVDEDFFDGIDAAVQEVPVVVTATSNFNAALSKSVTVTVYRVAIPSKDLVITADMYNADLSDIPKENITVQKDADGNDYMSIKFTKNNQFVFFELPEETDFSAYESLEISGKVMGQLTLRTFASDFSKNVNEWWDASACLATYPFYGGSRPERLEDGTPNGPFEKETETHKLSDILGKNSSSMSKTKYVILSTNEKPQDGSDFEEVTYDIFTLKFIPKTGDAEVESPSVETPAN